MIQKFLLIGGLLMLLAGCGARTPYVAPPAGDPAVCEVHHLPMRWSKVKIWYGLPSDDYFNGVPQFPHSGRGVCGGCMVRDEKFFWRWVCDACTESENQWKASRDERSKPRSK